jgi:hypothetical protein
MNLRKGRLWDQIGIVFVELWMNQTRNWYLVIVYHIYSLQTLSQCAQIVNNVHILLANDETLCSIKTSLNGNFDLQVCMQHF